MKKRSLKKPLSVLFGLGVSISLVGCTTSSTTSTNAATPKSINKDVVQIQYPQMTGLDTTAWAGQILVNQGTTFEGLFGYDNQNKIVPKLAESYTVTPDNKTWTFKLRKDAKWSNGDPVTAKDFYYAWMRLMAPSDSQGAIWASVMQYVENGWAYHGGAASADSVGLKVLDDYTLQVKLTQPHNIIPLLVLSSAMPLNQKATDAHPNNWWLPGNFVTDGPYNVKSFVQNGKVVLTKNPKYVPVSGQSVNNIKEIDLIPNTTVPVEAFMSGKIDVVGVNNPADIKYVDTHPQLKAQMKEAPLNTLTYFQWDKSEKPSALDNVKVRQAIAKAIDRDPIAKNVLSGTYGSTSVFGTPDWPAGKLEKGLPYNADDAKKLLSDAGYPNAKGLGTLYIYTQTKADNPNSISIAEAIAQELKQTLNIDTKIVPLAATQWGGLTWGGQNKDIQPGYNIATGTANWADPSSTPLQADQAILFPGTYGATPEQRQLMNKWYVNPYNPDDVKQFGDPNDKSKGVNWSDWAAMDAAAKSDIAWLNNWISQQPEPYRTLLTPKPSYQDQWNQFVKAWQTAKTNEDKNAAWVNAWKFLGTYSTGVGNTTAGIHEQVYYDQTQSQQLHDWRMLDMELENAVKQEDADQLTAKLVNDLMDQGYVVPLFYNKTIYLERAGLEGAQPNPWSWGNFYQMQYMNTK